MGLRLLGAFLGAVGGDGVVRQGSGDVKPRSSPASPVETRLVKRVVACLDVRCVLARLGTGADSETGLRLARTEWSSRCSWALCLSLGLRVRESDEGNGSVLVVCCAFLMHQAILA